jgi:hypothetical protein
MSVHHEIRFISQYADIGDHEWRARGCGVASLKMVMDFWSRSPVAARTATLDELLRAGVTGGAYMESIGWHHRGLANIAGGYGYKDIYNVDLAPRSPTPKEPMEAWRMMLKELRSGPVLASVWRHLDPPAGGHILVVHGWDGELVSIADPMEMTAKEGFKLLALKPFLRYFKNRYIVIRP